MEISELDIVLRLREECSEWGMCGCDSNINHDAMVAAYISELENRSSVPNNIVEDVGKELKRANELGFNLFSSAHEGYAVLLEEVDELKAHVWTKEKDRDPEGMRKEAIQVAAMAVKFVQSLDDKYPL